MNVWTVRNCLVTFGIEENFKQLLHTLLLQPYMLDIMFPLLKSETFDKSESFEPWFHVKLVLPGTNQLINHLTPNDHYSCRTAPLTSKHCILYIYSTNIGIAYFKHGINSPFFSLQNAVCFIILMYLVPVLFTFYIQSVLNLKKVIPAPKG